MEYGVIDYLKLVRTGDQILKMNPFEADTLYNFLRGKYGRIEVIEKLKQNNRHKEVRCSCCINSENLSNEQSFEELNNFSILETEGKPEGVVLQCNSCIRVFEQRLDVEVIPDKFRVVVEATEVITYFREYEVEAESYDEACRLVSKGDRWEDLTREDREFYPVDDIEEYIKNGTFEDFKIIED
jgi:hypothetical protein